jgi:cytochrome c-type biogenesis protein CcmE
MNAKMKLLLAGMIIAVVVVYVTYLGQSSSWQYYLVVDECQAQAERFTGKRLRVAGRIATGSLHISQDRRQATFVLSGDMQQIPVNCSGLLPDNLADSMDVVVEGTLQGDGHLQGQRVITRCASKYAPKDNTGSAAQAVESESPSWAK